MLYKLAFALTLGAALAVPALAKDEQPCGTNMVCASAPATVVKALQDAGYKAKLTTDKLGDPAVETAATGYEYEVLFYGCEKSKACDSLQFYISFVPDAVHTEGFANRWNGSKRFARMSVDDEKRLFITYDLSTLGGLTKANFADAIDWWTSALGELNGAIREADKASTPPASPAASTPVAN